MAKKAQKEPCPKWMRHKWVDVEEAFFSEETSADLGMKQQCSFCKGFRIVPLKVEEETEE